MSVITAPRATPSTPPATAQKMGPLQSTALVVGSIVGVGIFSLPYSLASYGPIILVAMVIAAVGALALAMVFASLSRRLPASGGPYAYARTAFGNSWGFANAWSYWITAWAGNAAIAVGWKRLMYLAMAGGSFVLTLAAFIVPGVPTVPFLLATGYCLARSSPRLNERLRHAWFFGPILREQQYQGGLSRFSKAKLTVLVLVIVGVTAVVTPLTPVILALIILVSSMSIYGIAGMPDLAEGPQGGPPPNGRAILALPAP